MCKVIYFVYIFLISHCLSCLSFISHCCDKNIWQNQFKEEKVYFGLELEGTSWWGDQERTSWGCWSSCTPLGSREQRVQMFCEVHGPSLGNGTSLLWLVFSSRLPILEHPSQAFPEADLISIIPLRCDWRPCLLEVTPDPVKFRVNTNFQKKQAF